MRLAKTLVALVAVQLLSVTGPASPGLALAKPAKAKKVLFVCTGNFYRSRFAEALFNTRTTDKEWSAFSRGLDTSTPREANVSPLVTDELHRLSIPESAVAGYPQQLKQEDIDKADVIVLLDRTVHEPKLKYQFPKVDMRKVRGWKVLDVPDMTADEAFSEISRQVDALLKDLPAAKAGAAARPAKASGAAH